MIGLFSPSDIEAITGSFPSSFSSSACKPIESWPSLYKFARTELKLEFTSKELAITYAKKNKIDFEIIEPKKRKIVKKSYADNFLN